MLNWMVGQLNNQTCNHYLNHKRIIDIQIDEILICSIIKINLTTIVPWFQLFPYSHITKNKRNRQINKRSRKIECCPLLYRIQVVMNQWCHVTPKIGKSCNASKERRMNHHLHKASFTFWSLRGNLAIK